MASNTPGMTHTFRAEGAVAKRRIVKHGASDNSALQGAAATDALIGVSTDLDVAAGDPCGVIRTGVAPVTYGGNVARGAPLTSDGQGRAVAAAPAAGANVRLIGFAEVAGVAGDLGSVLIAPSLMQG